jgi:hypothetical protein
MLKIILLFGILCSLTYTSTAQTHQEKLLGRWEDDASNNSTSYQFIFEKNLLAFLKIPQSKLLAPLKLTGDKLYQYKWVDKNILAYAKFPSENKMQAALYPPSYTFIQIDSISKDLLFVHLSDADLEKSEFDSLLKKKVNFKNYISQRKARYRRLNLEKERQTARLYGLWEDQISNDSLSFQLFAQKGELGFLKVSKNKPKTPTAIKPNAGYNYKWINDEVFYYYKQPSTGFAIEVETDIIYTLMRVEKLNRKELVVTLSTRSFNKSGLDYIKEENNFDLYFLDNKKTFQRIPIVEKK